MVGDIGPVLRIENYVFRFRQSFKTRTNTNVVLGETPDKQLMIIKTALPTNVVGSGPAELEKQVQQMRILNEILGVNSPFPPIIYFNGTTLITPYFGGGTLADIVRHDPALFRSRFHDALCLLFSEVGLVAQYGPDGRGFLDTQIEKRLKRLYQILEGTSVGRSFNNTFLSKEVLARRRLSVIEKWQQNKVFVYLGTALGPRRLALALHGDFVAENIVLGPTQSARWTRNVAFIDPRGMVVWKDSLPWWDPVMDLASFITFEEIVVPIEYELGIRTGSEYETRENYRDPSTWIIPHLCEELPCFNDWMSNDRRWKDRLVVSVFTRLLGYISIALAYGPPRGEVYAHRILLACSDVFEYVEHIVVKELGASIFT